MKESLLDDLDLAATVRYKEMQFTDLKVCLCCK